MATSIVYGTARDDWQFRAPSTNNTFPSVSTAAGSFAYIDTDNESRLVDLGPAEVANTAAVTFFGKGSLNKVCLARVWGVPAFGASSDPVYGRATLLFQLEVVLGSMMTGTSSPFSGDDRRYANAIKKTIDRTRTPPGALVIGGRDESAADIVFRTVGSRYLLVETSRNGGASDDDLGYLWRRA